MIQAILSRTEPQAMPSTQFKQLVGDLSNAIKTSYGKVAPILAGGKEGAGIGGSTFLESLGLSGLAKSYKQNAEAKEARRQSKENFVGNFQKYSEAGQNLSADTSRQVAESLFEEIDAKLQDLKKLEEEAKNRKEAGYGEDKNNTEQQNKLIEEIKKLQPNYGKEGSPQDKAIGAVQDEERKIEQAETQQKQYEVEQKTSDDLTALYTISDDYFKKMLEKTDKMLESLDAIKENGTGGGGGGLLGTAAELAGDLMGRGGKGGAAKTAGKALGAASKIGKFAKIGGGLLAVGTAAYEGYNEYQAADEQVKSGEITKEQGQVKKGEAVGGAFGGGGGALAGAAAGAALGSVVPVVGTAIGGLIGGALGYFGGKKVGQVVGGGAVKGYQALGGNNPNTEALSSVDAMGNPIPGADTSSAAATAPAAGAPKGTVESTKTTTEEIYIAKEKFTPGKPLSEKQMATIGMALSMSPSNKYPPEVMTQYNKQLQEKPVAPPPEKGKIESGAALRDTTRSVDVARETAQSTSSTSVVNAPQNITNVTNNNAGKESSKPAPKNEESTFNRYMDRRYYPARSF